MINEMEILKQLDDKGILEDLMNEDSLNVMVEKAILTGYQKCIDDFKIKVNKLSEVKE